MDTPLVSWVARAPIGTAAQSHVPSLGRRAVHGSFEGQGPVTTQ